MKLVRTAVAGIAVTAAVVTGGLAYAASAGTPTATKTDTIATTTKSVHLSATGGILTTIATLNLPPGAFVLHASGDLVNFGPSDYTRCQIFAAGTQIAAVASFVGDPSLSGARGPASRISPFALTGGAVNPTTSTVLAALRCSHDVSLGATPYVDADASLSAHKTSGLKLIKE
jgi:hypothetical protein